MGATLAALSGDAAVGSILATFRWASWFAHTRLRYALSFRTAAEVEAEYYRHNHSAKRPLAGQLGPSRKPGGG